MKEPEDNQNPENQLGQSIEKLANIMADVIFNEVKLNLNKKIHKLEDVKKPNIYLAKDEESVIDVLSGLSQGKTMEENLVKTDLDVDTYIAFFIEDKFDKIH